MGIFSTILSKLGFGGDKVAAAEQNPGAPADMAAAAPAAAAGAVPAMEMVDVVAKMEGLAAASKEKLNWKTSIVDLMKLLGMDSSLGSRKELATELGCPQDKMADSAQMNMWLHKAVLQKVAANGGNVPSDLV